MRKLFIGLMMIIGLLICSQAQEILAKHIPPKVDPVKYKHFMIYVCGEHRGGVFVRDITTNKIILDFQVYEEENGDGETEPDACWVFITAMEVKGDLLYVTNENDNEYEVDLSAFPELKD